MNRATLSIVLLLTAALAGCSGGGSSGGNGVRVPLGSTAASSSSTPSSVTSATGGVTTSPSTRRPGAPPSGSTQPGSGSATALSLTVTAPQKGDQLPAGATIVKGTAPGAKLITVNGQPVTPGAGGAFAATATLVEGANIIDVVAMDAAGHSQSATIGVLAGTFVAPTALVKNAAKARITNDALKAASPAIDAELMKNLKALKGAHLGDWAVSVLGRTIKTSADVSNVAIQSTDVLVQSQTAGLHGSLSGKGVDADLMIKVDAGTFFGVKLGFSHTLDLHFDRVSADGMLRLVPANNNVTVDTSGLKLDYAPTVIASIIGQGNLNAINSLLGSIGSVIGANLKIDEVGLVNKFAQMAFNQGLKQTADTQIASLIVTTGQNGVPVAMGSTNASVYYTLDGFATDALGFTVSNDLDVRIALPDAHASKGSLATTGAAPALNATTGLQVALNQDMVNRVLEAAWRKGQLDIDLAHTATGGGGLSTAAQLAQQLTFSPKDLALLVPALNAFIPAGAGFEITAIQKAPPILFLSSGGKATLEVTDLALTISVKVPGINKVDLMVLETNVQAPVSFSLVGSSALKLDVGAGKYTFDLQRSIVPLDKNVVNTALQFVVPTAVQFGAKLVGPIPLPAATVGGLTPTVKTLTTDGSKGTFIRADISVK